MPIPPATARRILEVLLERGGSFAEVFAESRDATALGYEGGVLEDAGAGCDRGAALRLVAGDVTHFANGNDVTGPALVARARALASALPEDGRARAMPPLEARDAPRVSLVRADPSAVAVASKAELLRRADVAAREYDARVTQVSARYRDTVRTVLVANSEGRCVRDRIVYVTLSVSVVARRAGLVRHAYRSASGTCGLELAEQEPPEELARDAARVACQQLDADPAPAGTFTIVLSSKAGGTMVHEACGHGLEADFIDKGLSVFAGRLGRRIASERITVVDDGTLAGKRGSFGIDDEGTPSERTVLIDKGVLTAYLHSLHTARRLGQRPTGNGRRESYRHLPIPRMRNTMILPGEDDPEAILASVSDGIFVADMGGGEVDIVSGNFVFHCTEAYRIRDGKIAEPLRDAILTGSGPEVLEKIDRVGRDLGFQVGTCGKDGQGVPVADAQPTLRIPGIVVGGQAP
jgi:TldD protein